ncbi:MAG: thioredoxin family protein [Planctomicrobium sp.]|jgi:thioredoxin-related protein|nr:thioredoxin family protein [Planctomicrobium sp.]
MKPLVACAAVLSLSLCSMMAVQAAPPFSLARPSEHQLNWQSNLQAAHRQAVSENKPMLLVFGADWCHFCKKLEKETLNSNEMAKYINSEFVPIHLDTDKDKKVAEILKVSSLPCSIVLSPNADLLGRIEGFHTTAPFHKQLAAAKQRLQIVQRTSSSSQ